MKLLILMKNKINKIILFKIIINHIIILIKQKMINKAQKL